MNLTEATQDVPRLTHRERKAESQGPWKGLRGPVSTTVTCLCCLGRLRLSLRFCFQSLIPLKPLRQSEWISE